VGSSLVQDINVLYKDQRDTVPIRWWDWVKREPPDELIRGYLETILPEMARRIEQVETFLERGMPTGQAFVRASERPSVGSEALSQAIEPLLLRLDRIEQKLGERGTSATG
jgi:hypothetical protein